MGPRLTGRRAPSDRILERLLTLHPRLIDLSLDRVMRLLKTLGDPQDELPPVIHVAGTNGKGSTIAFLRAFLETAGKRVHVYTSPHLVRFHERIRLAGKVIPEKMLGALLAECERANAGQPITFFEITTAAAFLAFAREDADIALIEVGLGGRFDATNVITKPAIAVLTPISLDHQHFLGETVAAIAFEKAGILKLGTPVVVGPQPAEAATVIAARAAELRAPLYRHGQEWSVEHAEGGGLIYRGRQTLHLPPPGLAGAHQYDNAGAALAALECLPGFALGAAAMARGIGKVEWPARLQRLGHGPLVKALPAGAELWLDGAHNAAGGEALARFVAGWRRPTGLVFGMIKTHDPTAFLKPLAPYVARLSTVAIPGETNTLNAEESAAAARTVGIEAVPAKSLRDAVAAASAPGNRTLICGSLYLAGKVLAANG
ncbi:MAG: bifunctional folylpolyglutamate synthase/dihydrofolate synthase [Alphaproteobacteria bacterium]|nr:bifunctional folylpolyglutamate synthase/dihydrofolate synthase [Alphaproteobacteria bacterium]